jgi:hypothetical protein
VHNTDPPSSGWKTRSRFEAFSPVWFVCLWLHIQLKQTRETKPLRGFFKIICDYMLLALCRVSIWVKPGWYFRPGWSLILIVHSCQQSKPTVAHVLFGVGIFRCENAVFSQSGEAFPSFLWNAFQPRSERERSVRLFLSSTVLALSKYIVGLDNFFFTTAMIFSY